MNELRPEEPEELIMQGQSIINEHFSPVVMQRIMTTEFNWNGEKTTLQHLRDTDESEFLRAVKAMTSFENANPGAS